jgi:flagellar biosynthesis protein FlhB
MNVIVGANSCNNFMDVIVEAHCYNNVIRGPCTFSNDLDHIIATMISDISAAFYTIFKFAIFLVILLAISLYVVYFRECVFQISSLKSNR